MTDTRIPQQPRSKNTKTRITKAAFKLFSQKGIHGTNTKEIAEKAGVATGSVYAYYKNKKQLLLEILENFLNDTYVLIWKDLPHYDINKLSHDNIKSIVENVFKAYDVAPQFLSQTHALRYSDPEINRIYVRERQREVAQIIALMESNKDRLNISDPLAAAIILHNAVEHVAHTAKFIGSEIEESRLINELTNIIYGYLAVGLNEGNNK